MRILAALPVFFAILLNASAVKAQTSVDQTAFTASVRAGSLGIGPEADLRFGGLPFGVRAGINAFGLGLNNVYHNHFSGSGSGYSYDAPVNYGGNLQLLNGGITEDWYPFHSGFRLSVGEYINGNQLTAHATTNGTLTLNGTTYTGNQVGEVDGKATVNTFVPYLGLGYEGALFGPITFSADAGVLYQGSPKVSLSASGPIANIPEFQSELASQRSRIQHDIDYPFYPVLQIGFGYRF